MSLVCVSGSDMASDGATFDTAGLRHPMLGLKVFRFHDDRSHNLVGAVGSATWITTLGEWVCAGMDWDQTPAFVRGARGEDELQAVWLSSAADRPGRPMCFFMDERLDPYEVPTPCAIGPDAEVAYALGAMDAGASALQAVTLAIKRCHWCGGTPIGLSLGDPT